MGNKTEDIPVYPVSVFGADHQAFWLHPLQGILELYPHLGDPHKQDFYTLLYVRNAIGSIMLDNRIIRIEESGMIYIKPNSVFSLKINKKAEGYILCFTNDYFSLRYNNNVLLQFSFFKNQEGNSFRLTKNQSEKLVTILQLMEGEFSSQPKGVEKVLRSYLNVLLYDLERLFPQIKRAEKKGSREEKMILFEKFIEAHYQNNKTPSFYAEKLHISTHYLNKLCKDYYGVSSGGLIRKRVVTEAQRLLYFTSLSVAEVGYHLGFENASYFITFFKKNMGITPEIFRKNQEK